jgi:hypothetical protein
LQPVDNSNRGERTAAAMENQLTALERKIDDLLASVDEQHQQTDGSELEATNTKLSNEEEPKV